MKIRKNLRLVRRLGERRSNHAQIVWFLIFFNT